MSACNILEDLKVLEQDLDAREDIKKAIEDHIADFNSKNSSTQSGNPSRWGIKVTPSAPQFHPNYPSGVETSITTSDAVMGNGGTLGQYYRNQIIGGEKVSAVTTFRVVASNLNCFPVYDAKTKKRTNGCEDNIGLGTEFDGIYIEQSRKVPFTDPIVEKYNADPTNPKWQKWKFVGGGIYDPDLGGFIDDPNDPNNKRMYEPFNPDDYSDITSSIIKGEVLSWEDGSVQIDFTCEYIEIDTVYDIPIEIFVQNGNGKATKSMKIAISTGEKNLTSYPRADYFP